MFDLSVSLTAHGNIKHVTLPKKIWDHLQVALLVESDETHEQSILGSADAIVGPVKF